jgi:GGDEF domain-containing protein
MTRTILYPLTGLRAGDQFAGRVDQLQATAPGVLVARLLVDEQAIAAAHGHGLCGDVLAAIDVRIHLHTEPLGGTAVQDGTEFLIVVPLPAGAVAYRVAWARHQIATLRTRVTVPAHQLGGHTVPVTAVLGAVLAAGGGRRWALGELLRAAGEACAADRAGGDPLSLLPGDLRADHPLASAAYAAAGEHFLED